jgi:HSP20 family molecular chaperone IbpA
MATSKPALTDKAFGKAPQIIGENQKDSFDQAVRKKISQRAYSIYETSGRQDGNQDAHWLQAEEEILQRGLEIRESGSWLSVNASLPDVSGEDIQIYLEPQRVTVRAGKPEPLLTADAQEPGPTQREIILVGDLNMEIEPETASAAFKDQRLTLMVKKKYPVSAPGDCSSGNFREVESSPVKPTPTKSPQAKS